VLITFLKSKIHRASLTEANLLYEGSIGIDQDLMDAAGIRSFEKVYVLNANNGHRLSTYAIAVPRGSGEVTLNGAAARLGMPRDIVIILAYGIMDERECVAYNPKIVYVNDKNLIISAQPGKNVCSTC
jgi:aspartate 1-decarboxylase